MAKGSRGRRGIASRQCRPTPYPLPSCGDMQQKHCSKTFKKDWVDATCSVCMECPHNAVLLLCSSYEKGCRPYMCGTSFRYSNCLDQYKKAYTKPESPQTLPPHPDLVCPLCRGQVKGWTVVEPARAHLNTTRRSCMQDDCSFVGTFKELRKHVKVEHPCAKPREVDPMLEQKWRRLEREQEREDVMSTIRSSTPGAVFFGDYVIEGSNNNNNNGYGLDSDDDEDDSDDDEDGGGFNEGVGIDRSLMSVFLFLQAFGSSARQERETNDGGGDEDGDGDDGTSLVGRLRR
ncbi:hypothetical protein PHJA_001531200 [Phtheirospermum japonicum]|uniref:Uncharacterized protein n=1 Tax=Phtheirospermum japonicum TaxID=374723 RepID=A0A830C489_9LAMI|nr:hypothetical protein PHJA_001531200 [Phtheirospermum japonicum]